MKSINPEELSAMKESYLKDDKARVVRNALFMNDLGSISRDFQSVSENPNIFSIDIKTMPATNQQKSGRCWIFSALNVLREMAGKKYGIKEFELSQNFIAFYDKLEKTNFFLEAMIAEIDAPMGSETKRYLLEQGISDGGQWDMFVSIVKKYGLCPKSAMPETFQSSNTRNMNALLNLRLRRFAAEAQSLAQSGNRDQIALLKKDCLEECYRLIVSCFGMPPASFTFEYTDKEEKHHAVYDVTPLDFYHSYFDVDLDDYVGIINGPTKDKPFHKMYTVKYLGNVVDGNPIRFLNLPMDEFKEMVLKQLQNGEIVWFGCDCGKDGDRQSGLWDDKLFDYAGTFDMHLDMTKEEMLDTRHSAMNHAMVFTGVNLVDGKPTRWKIENSWGDKTANKGYYLCSDTWFEKYVYEAFVPKKYLGEELLKVLEEEPKELLPWDPFGSLAD